MKAHPGRPSNTPGEPLEVAVIGAGVVGCAIARALARRRVRVALIEAAADVGAGTSKANTAIWHTGFDATPGTLESHLVRRGHALLATIGPELGIPVERTGALVVAWSDEEHDRLPAILDRARENGYEAATQLDAHEVHRREPHLAHGLTGAVAIPDEGILCPFSTPLAFATDAVRHGAILRRNWRVDAVEDHGDIWRLTSASGHLDANWVVNAAGLHADVIDRMFGYDRMHVTPRRGQLLVFDKFARRLVDSIILPLPTARTKGVLVAPTVFGNLLVGPTAEDLEDRDDTATTSEALVQLRAAGARLVPRLAGEEVTATYAGLRAAIDRHDYLISGDHRTRYVCIGGIRSTGMTAALGIAEHVVEQLGEIATDGVPSSPGSGRVIPPIGECGDRPYASGAAIAADDDYGRIVCFCERVTLAEIRDCFATEIPPNDLGGLRRRTRALLGRCQGFACRARIEELAEGFAAEAGVSWPTVSEQP